MERLDQTGSDDGSDSLIGGAGVDTVIEDLSSQTPGTYSIYANLTTGMHYRAETPASGVDTLQGIENYTLLGAVDGEIVGSSGANALQSDAGDDSINGFAGDDTLTSGDGNDTLIGGLGADAVVVATGSTPGRPAISGIHEPHVHTAHDAITGGVTGARVVVLDSGEADWKCLTTAERLASDGHEVTIVTPVAGNCSVSEVSASS